MSDHSLYNLNTAYPFIWKEGVFPDALKSVQDMRFVYVLPSNLKIPSPAAYTFKLKALNNTTATVLFGFQGNNSEKTVPVVAAGANAGGSSFVILDKELSEPWEAAEAEDGADIHPDCLVLLQEAPTLSVEVTGSYDTDHHRESQMLRIPDSAVLTFRNGHNVAASGTSQGNVLTLTLDCGSENGLGIWRESPWADEGLPTFDAVGLRSINGVAGDVRILGDASVVVDVTVSESVVNLAVTGRTSGYTS